MGRSRRLVIAVDCDDVLVDSALAVLDHYHATYGVRVPAAEAYSMDPDLWGVDHIDEAVKRVLRYHQTAEYQQLPPIRDAVGALRTLRDRHEIHLVTGRPDSLRSATLDWLTEHFPDVFASTEFTNFIVPTEHRHVTRSKADVCVGLAADILIEDNPHHARLVAGHGVHVLLYGDYPWNRTDGVVGPNVTRVRDWAEVLAFIDSYGAMIYPAVRG